MIPEADVPAEVAGTMKRSITHPLAAFALWLMATVLYGAPAGAQEAWHYVLNETHPERQANFCASEADVRDVVMIFERFGARTGYSALSGTDNCFIAVNTFTPQRVVEEIVIAEGEPSEYRMRFVEGYDENGKVLFLVTTREVRPE